MFMPISASILARTAARATPVTTISQDEINSILWKACDTIRSPLHHEGDHLMRFNVVTANPPFSLDKWGHSFAQDDPFKRFCRGLPLQSVGDYAFITHMIENTYIEPGQNGRFGVLFLNVTTRPGVERPVAP